MSRYEDLLDFLEEIDEKLEDLADCVKSLDQKFERILLNMKDFKKD